jgi:hypothetical protein
MHSDGEKRRVTDAGTEQATTNSSTIISSPLVMGTLLPDAPRPATIAAYYRPLGARRSAPHNQRLQPTARAGKQACPRARG